MKPFIPFTARNTLASLRRASFTLPLLLAACAAIPPPRPAPFKPLAPPPQFKEVGLWKRAATPAADTVSESWWQAFQDPVLDGLQRQLVIGNENILSALTQVAAARATLQAGEAALFPTLSVSGAGGRSGTPAGSSSGNVNSSNNSSSSSSKRNTANSFSLTANAAWEIDLWGRLSLATTLANAKLQASQDTVAAVRLSAQATLVQGYFTLRAAEAQLALLDRTASANQRALDITQARYAAGVVSQSDVLQAQTQLKTVQAQARESVVLRAQGEHAIAVLLGLPPSALSIGSTASLPQLPAVPALLPSTLLERRPDIAAAERNVAAAWAQIGISDAAFYPDFSLSASAGYRGSALGGLLAAPNLLWSLGTSVAEAVFDGGSRQLASAQARASAEQAASSYRQTVLTALQEVEDNLVVVDQLAAELQLQQAALQAAQRNLLIVQDQYQAGTVSYLNVVTAQTSALSAEGTVLSLRNRQLAAAGVLLKNIGGRLPL